MASSWPVRAGATVVVALLLLPGAAYAAPALVGQDGAFIVLSGSMTPFFVAGDVIFVQAVDPESLQVGDVITFRASPGSSTLITHRVLEVVTDGNHVRYRTQGDANEDPDPFMVHPGMVVGKYAWHLPAWGYVYQAFRHPALFLALIFVPSGLLAGQAFLTLYRELDAWDRRRTGPSPDQGERR